MRTVHVAMVAACALLGCAGAGSDVRPQADGSDDPSPLVDSPVSHPGKVPLFIAQGTLGRTMVSCDDGVSWVGNHSWDIDGDPMMCDMPQDVTCGQTCSYSIDGTCQELQCCNDTPDIPEGVVFGPTAIVGVWGHGKPGAVRSSVDGLGWSTRLTSYAFSIAYGSDRFVAAGNYRTAWSTDGVTWMAGGEARFNTGGSPVRAFGYGDYGEGGRFVAVSAGGTARDILVSSDGGGSWWRPTSIPDSCARGVGTGGGDVLGFGGRLVIVDSMGTSCVSLDGGDTWSVHATGLTSIPSHGVWTGTELVYWGENQLIRSTDGVTWSATPLVTPTRIGPTARSDTGAFVAIPYLYDAYDRQHFLRSLDGLSWDELPTSSAPQSHSIFRITFGYGDPSALCPAR